MNSSKTNNIKTVINNDSNSLLIISSNFKSEELHNVLLENPSLVNTKDQKNETLLSYAIKRKNKEIAELILASPLLDISYLDLKGNSYLHLAVISQLENIIKTLIKKGININIQNTDGNTALHFAYNTGDILFIAILIENNADLNIKNKNGLTPEEIEMDSLSVNLDINNGNLNTSNTNTNNEKPIKSDTKTTNNNESNNSLLTNEKNKINKSIKIHWENNDIFNKTNHNKNTLESSLANLSSNDNDDNMDDYDDNKEEQIEDEEEKKYYINKINNGYDSHKPSDIFDLTSSLTYKAKLANLSCMNSHIVGSPNMASKNDNVENDDIVNIKKFKTEYNKPFYKSIYNNKVDNKKEEKSNIQNIINNNRDNKHTSIEYSTLISKENKNMLNVAENNDKYNYSEKINQKTVNNDNIITYNSDDKFCFSPFGTIKESIDKKEENNINNKSIKLEIQQAINNSLKNINLNNNNSINNNNISNNINNRNNNESSLQQQENTINSKSNIDSCSSLMSSDHQINKSKLINNAQDLLYLFLLEIKLEKYYNIMNSNGFGDIQLLINKTKNDIVLTDTQLKKAGINRPGDRAKIIIRLQEKAENFNYHVPKVVYYICEDKENYMNDNHINKIYQWLKTIKIENYLENFINGGYHCIELMLFQMGSQNPITDSILKDDLGINKIGHRARIINKLLEDGKKFNNKLKNSTLVFGNGETEKICECIIC